MRGKALRANDRVPDSSGVSGDRRVARIEVSLCSAQRGERLRCAYHGWSRNERPVPRGASEPARAASQQIRLKSIADRAAGGCGSTGPAADNAADEYEFATVKIASASSQADPGMQLLQAMEGGTKLAWAYCIATRFAYSLFKGAKGNEYNLRDAQPSRVVDTRRTPDRCAPQSGMSIILREAMVCRSFDDRATRKHSVHGISGCRSTDETLGVDTTISVAS